MTDLADKSALEIARSAMVETGQWNSRQMMGRRFAVGCVALEITQRCNLDCSACYLSEHSEAVRDLPLEEVFRRVDMIRETYGPDTDVQVTGGDPTLRNRDELIAIVRYIRHCGMRATLFTNGIRARRDLLVDLSAAGLTDVAFHVDLTQRRPGYETEQDLNRLRLEYIERVRGLPLAIYFNTTVFAGNFDQVPDVVAFFVTHSDAVRVASFQPEARTGRGLQDGRSPAINVATVIAKIAAGSGASLRFDTLRVGHDLCNRIAIALVADGTAIDVLDHPQLVEEALALTASTAFPRDNPRAAFGAFLRAVMRSPAFIYRALPWLAGKLWRHKTALLRSGGQVNKLTFYIHNFMDACALDPERLRACVFTAATDLGPVPMCQHNAQRDETILRPIRISSGAGEQYWNPITGVRLGNPATVTPPTPGSIGRRRALTEKCSS